MWEPKVAPYRKKIRLFDPRTAIFATKYAFLAIFGKYRQGWPIWSPVDLLGGAGCSYDRTLLNKIFHWEGGPQDPKFALDDMWTALKDNLI